MKPVDCTVGKIKDNRNKVQATFLITFTLVSTKEKGSTDLKMLIGNKKCRFRQINADKVIPIQ